MEITRNEAQVRMFNRTMLELLVNDNEYGLAIDSFERVDDTHNRIGYFEKSIDERADMIVKMIQKQTEWALKTLVKEILENNEKEQA